MSPADQVQKARPPFKGDTRGHIRIAVVGNSGAGKSTISSHLSDVLDLPHLALDALHWQPGWVSTPSSELRDKVLAAIEDAERTSSGWIVDGNYTSALGDTVFRRATDIIWLDPPLAMYLPMIIWRTTLRLFRIAPPCAPGCLERPSEVFFSKESIVWWCITHHRSVRKRFLEMMKDKELGERIQRIRGWTGRSNWLRSVDSWAMQREKDA